MTLNELIKILEGCDPDRVVEIGFANPHSWRGSYMELGFEPRRAVTIGSMLEAARSAIGQTYQGWKGGDFEMDEYVTVHLGWEGTADDYLPELGVCALVGIDPTTPAMDWGWEGNES